MSSNLSLLPYKYNVTYNSSALTIPAFPGAYIYSNGIDTSPTALPVPIYCSEPVATSFVFDRDYMLLVLPGFKVEIYADVSFGTFKYSVDNTAGTDIKFVANKTGSYTMSSYKLIYSFPMVGTQELTMNMVSSSVVINYGNAEISSPLTYDNTSYTLYSYKTTTGTSTFQYTGPTDVPALVLVVAGGGTGGTGGGGMYLGAGGGGGAGQMTYGTLNITTNVTYTITVGAGGALSKIANGATTIVQANAGGAGGNGQQDNASAGGSSGGAGGFVGAIKTSRIVSQYSNTGFTNLGNTGGNGGFSSQTSSGYGGGGGGGGAGGVGGAGSPGAPGSGGVGSAWPINNITYATGGTGGNLNTAPSTTSSNLGNGGQGGGSVANRTGSSGGSGIVIIAIRTADLYKVSL